MHYVNAKAILGNDNGMNIYRGCLHGCIYCDARSLCYGFTHRFEDIEVKKNAPELLEKSLKKKRKKSMIGTGAMCDPYIPLEKELLITRKCLEIIDRYQFGAAVLTKSSNVLRDLDLFKSINTHSKAVIQMTLTTYDEALCKIIEPNVSSTKERVEALKIFSNEGISCYVWLCPILPYINDTEENINGILDYCEEANVKGIINFGMGLTLRAGDREYYYKALEKHFPGLKQKYEKEYGNAYELPSPNEKEIYSIFYSRCKKAGIKYDNNEIFRDIYTYPKKYEQLGFDL